MDSVDYVHGAPNEIQRGVSRRQISVATAVGSIVAIVGPSPAAHAAGTLTQAQHNTIPIRWNHPFSQRADTRRGVEGYPYRRWEERPYPSHRGTDYYVTPRAGTPVCAVADGTVTNARYEPDGRGQFVTINHGSGVYGDYCHFIQGSTLVTIGQAVTGGTPVGLTGFTGYLDPPSRELTSPPSALPIRWNKSQPRVAGQRRSPRGFRRERRRI